MERIQIVSLILRVKDKYAVERRYGGKNLLGYEASTMHAFPSGHVEKGEAHADAIIREMKEELGIVMADAIAVHEAPVDTDGAELYITWFVCTAYTGTPTNAEGQELAWLSEEDVIRRMHHAGYDALKAAINALQ